MIKRTLLILVVSLMFLQGCSSSEEMLEKEAVETPASTQLLPTQAISIAPKNTLFPTQKSYNSSPELMVVPENIKKEVLFHIEGQTGAPEGFRELFVYPIGGIEGGVGCEDTGASAPYFLHSPSIFEALSTDPWGEDRIDTCGWASGESINITVTKPDGTQEIIVQTFDGYMSVSYRPLMAFGMQLGEYSITFDGPSGSISHGFTIVRPTLPGMAKVNEHDYFVFGLDENEPIIILSYKISQEDHTIRLITWKEAVADYRGELFVEDKVAGDLLAVVGDLGIVVWSDVYWGIFIGDKIFYQQVAPCDGAPMSRLQSYDMAYVLEGAPNNVRSSPSVAADLVGTVAPGTVLYVGKKDPVCAEGYLWWYVFPKDGIEPTGWTAEGKGSVYWLAPLK